MLKIGLALMTFGILAGCASTPKGKPLLTNRALAWAAAQCNVKSLGVHFTRNSKVPYGDYLAPPAEVDKGPDERPSTQCMLGVLKGYRLDFLGQVERDPGIRSGR